MSDTPTPQAMKAVRVLYPTVSGHENCAGCELHRDERARIIDRETGLPELLAERDSALQRAESAEASIAATIDMVRDWIRVLTEYGANTTHRDGPIGALSNRMWSWLYKATALAESDKLETKHD